MLVKSRVAPNTVLVYLLSSVSVLIKNANLKFIFSVWMTSKENDFFVESLNEIEPILLHWTSVDA